MGPPCFFFVRLFVVVVLGCFFCLFVVVVCFVVVFVCFCLFCGGFWGVGLFFVFGFWFAFYGIIAPCT